MTAKAKRRLRWTLGTLAVLALAVVLIGPRVVAPILRARLQHMVSAQLNAELAVGKLTYQFPYGVTARDVQLIAKDPFGTPIDLLYIKELQLALAEFPRRDRPLVIEKIYLDQPIVRMIFTDKGGVAGGEDLVRDDAPAPQPKAPGREKPSDYFRLRHFAIREGQVLYEDRRRGQSGEPVVWKNLTAELDTQPTSGSLYAFDLSARNAPLAQVNVRGKIDIDTLDLDVEKYVLAVKAEPGAQYPVLPPHLRAFIESNRIEGALTLSGTAHVPLRQPQFAMHESVLDLPHAGAQLSALEGRLDRLSLRLRMSSEIPPELRETAAIAAAPAPSPAASSPVAHPYAPPLYLALNHAEVASGDTVLRLEKGAGFTDPATGQWHLAELLGRLEIGHDRRALPTPVEKLLNKFNLTGKMKFTAMAGGPLRPRDGGRFVDAVDYRAVAYPREASLHLPKWPLALTNLSGIVRANKEVITLENVEGNYADDKFYLTSARIPLDGIDQLVRVEEASGTVVASGRAKPYPRFLDWVGRYLRPAGTFYVAGGFARRKDLPPGQKPDFHFDVRADNAALAVAKQAIPVTDVKAELSVTPQLVDVKRVEGRSLGGTVTAECQVTPGRGPALAYHGVGYIREVDVATLGKYIAPDGNPPKRLNGRGSMNIRFGGTGPDEEHSAIDLFTADGRVEIVDGDFWEIPVLKEIAGRKLTNEALTAGEAAALFEVRKQVVHLRQAAVSAPVLGLQGAGTIDFDRNLDLRVVAAPLADWKDQMKRTKIPVVSDVAGEILGGLQAVINTASKTLLYEFRVTGTTRHPKIETVPAPVLTDTIAGVFGAMLKGQKMTDVIKDDQAGDARKRHP